VKGMQGCRSTEEVARRTRPLSGCRVTLVRRTCAHHSGAGTCPIPPKKRQQGLSAAHHTSQHVLEVSDLGLLQRWVVFLGARLLAPASLLQSSLSACWGPWGGQLAAWLPAESSQQRRQTSAADGRTTAARSGGLRCTGCSQGWCLTSALPRVAGSTRQQHLRQCQCVPYVRGASKPMRNPLLCWPPLLAVAVVRRSLPSTITAAAGAGAGAHQLLS
jgi:hypothetical protein